eukprot:6134617-Alexandrium_andersonii.AAC.1
MVPTIGTPSERPYPRMRHMSTALKAGPSKSGTLGVADEASACETPGVVDDERACETHGVVDDERA